MKHLLTISLSLSVLTYIHIKPTNGATLPLGTIVHFNAASCPTDFTPVTGHRGRVFIGAPEGSIPTRVNSPAVTPYGDAQENKHTHTDSLQVASMATGYSPEGSTTGTCGATYYFTLKAGATVGSPSPGISPSPSASPGHAFTQLLACKLNNASPNYQLPLNAVVYMDADTGSEIISCSPTPGWSAFAAAAGRVIVPADPSLVDGTWAPAYYKQSPTAFMPTSQPDFVGHSHTVNFPSVTGSNYSPTVPSCPDISGSSNPLATPKPTPANAVAGTFASASPQIPFTRALVCQSTTDFSSGTQIPTGGLVFFSSASCPIGWSTVSRYKGRIIVNLPTSATNGTLFGSATLLSLATGDSGPATHAHDDFPYSFTASIPIKWSSYICTTGGTTDGYCTPNPTSVPTTDPALQFGTATMTFTASSGTIGSATADIPYITMLQCSKDLGTSSPVKAPSSAPKKPSHSPSTSPRKPSKSPSKSPKKPTKSPSKSPHTKPTSNPTYKPGSTRNPSHNPSQAPTAKTTTGGSDTAPALQPSGSNNAAPTKPTTPSSSPTSSVGALTTGGSSDTTGGLIAGVAAGGTVVVALIIVGLVILYRRRKANKQGKNRTAPTMAGYLNMAKGNYIPMSNVGGKNSSADGSSLPGSVGASSAGGLNVEMSNPMYTNQPIAMGMPPPGMMVNGGSHVFVSTSRDSARPPRPISNIDLQSNSGKSVMSAVPASVSSASSVPQLRCISNFDAENPDELTLVEGEMVRVLENHGEWVIAQSIQSGGIGMVPRSYLTF